MSCRHDLANGTCIRCYPSNPDDRHPADRIDPGPESDHESNLDGPGAVAAEQAVADAKQPTAAETKQRILHLIRCYGRARGAEVGADWRNNREGFERHGATAKEAWRAIDGELDELLTAVERMAPVVAAADAWRDDPCKGLGSHREAALADAIDDYRAKVRGAKPDGAA